jgi:hypothetical protein
VIANFVSKKKVTDFRISKVKKKETEFSQEIEDGC